MNLLNWIKEKIKLRRIERKAVIAVEEAKKRELSNQKAVILVDEAKELAEKLGVTVEEAVIYLKKEKKQKQIQENKKRFAEKTNKVLKSVGKFAESSNSKITITEAEKTSNNPKVQSKKKKEEMNFDFAVGMLGGNVK